MGGGAGAGGGAAGSGSGSGQGQGANGQNGGNDASGGGQGAGGCGPGSPGSCSNCGHNLAAGDPVDIATGRVFTLPALDAFLAGPLPFEFYRSYSSHSIHRDVGLGFGWTHSYGWELVIHRRKVELWDDTGTMLELPIPPEGGSIQGPKGRLLYRQSWGFTLQIGGLKRHFAARSGARYRLTGLEDRNGNRITLLYQDDRLTEIVDSVGRRIRVGSTPEGRISSIEVKNAPAQGRWLSFVRYEYNERGQLLRVLDPCDSVCHYEYDLNNLLLSYTHPDSPTSYFVYDTRQRCTETWVAYPDGHVPGLADNVPALLADGTTAAKGFLHCKIEYYDDGYREIIDSMQVRRAFCNEQGLTEKTVAQGAVTTRTFDKHGFLTSHTDALGAVSFFERDGQGRTISITNALGNRTFLSRNPEGFLEEVSDALGTILRARYDERGNLVELEKSRGEHIFREYNPRGCLTRQILPNGGESLYQYDAQCNLVREKDPDGSEWLFGYDALGQCIEQTDPRGAKTLYSYDLCGRLIEIRYPSGSVERRTYNGVDDLIQIEHPDGQLVRFEHLLRRPVTVTHADGSTLEYRYNREGFLVLMLNELGESRVLEPSPSGQVLEIRSFNGRHTRFQFDAMDRLIGYWNGRGEKTEYERNLLGQVVRVLYPDDTSCSFSYDTRGQLLRAQNGTGEFLWKRDEAGQVLREQQIVEGHSYWVEQQYDEMRSIRSMLSSLGHRLRYERDPAGRTTRLWLGEKEQVTFAYDPVGMELERAFSGGGRIESRYDLGLRLRRRRVLTGKALSETGHRLEPEWVAELPGRAIIDKAFEYGQGARSLVRRWDNRTGHQEYLYDSRGQLLRRNASGKEHEVFHYDAARNVYEGKSPQRYGPGNTLEQKGDTTYLWDADGCLVEKTTRLADGSERRWTYQWNGQGLLSEVNTPTGLVVRFSYDPFARRVAKKLYQKDKSGALSLLRQTRFVWFGKMLVHEITQSPGTPGQEHRRSYVYDDKDLTLLAQREQWTEKGASPWAFSVNDPIGTPEQLVGSDGSILGQLTRKAWGQTQLSEDSQYTSPHRFLGQYEDIETGLHYNRYRYYDPDTGRYISEDPAGGLPDPNVYAYCINSINWVDPLGLVHRARGTFTPQNGAPVHMETTSSYDSEPDDYSRRYNEEHHITPFENLTATDENNNLMHRTSDTEAQFIRQLEGMENDETIDLDRGHLEIDGTLPPCSSCHQRMARFAEQHNCTVEYRWTGEPNNRNVEARSPGVRRYP